MNSKEINTFDEIATMIKKASEYDVLIVKYNKLEKENQVLKIKNTRLEDYKINYRTAIAFMQAQKEEMQKVREENTKLKKAISILKNKKVYIYGVKSSSSVKQYNNTIIGTELDKLTKEEYELLKEVLDCDSN